MGFKRIEATIVTEEKRTVVWFLWLFYLITIGYDLGYYFIFPKFYDTDMNFALINIAIYIVLFALIPIAYRFIKQCRQDLVKYLYFISYTIIVLIQDIFTYYGSNLDYKTGNGVEVFFILFSPIFINKRFYKVVLVGTILKYIILGFILGTTNVLAPIILMMVFGVVAYIFLNRFTGYVRAIEDSFDKQLQGIVKGVIATLELKDPYTRGHSERVASYALIMAKEIGKFSNKELKEFNYACLLHDVGKINIPDQILMKPQRLTDEEYEIIKTHPTVGAKALEGVEGLKNGIQVIHFHHERWDGKGYPNQLAGEDIPLLARITSYADAFDAMTSSRSYREAMPLEVAYQRIIQGLGTQFDPNLEGIFNKSFPKWKEFHQNYPWVN
ncbi:HD-GYP domain-containing protein [Bacillus sp. DNRA2]|uniref:HD-GYP domain-containing protein n=1 Tax=Bacillus sp. DNRA2 TaxID=2723053 RepID=UPI00145F266F|nr:HD-GYP domain-containing protein [Bacillus sp. DNRA2]NMD69742.1 HD-GYP domain-containing protein [Bacillus sp. DNRA2]